VVAAPEERHQLDMSHIAGSLDMERHTRITTRLTSKVEDRQLVSALRADDQVDFGVAGKRRRDVFAELDRRASHMQKALIYAELLGKPRAQSGPLRRAPTRHIGT
jgi:hypothetical protein